MVSLMDYEILTQEVFYRSEHILNYIERHPNLSLLDKEAIENTILDALVAKNLIDPTKQSLDLENLCIQEDLNHKVYNNHPDITSIPLSIKEKMRQQSLVITGSVPLSVFYSKPAGKVSYCIYDMNTALSSLFSNFSFIDCSYDSPTRPGIRAENRPFLEIEINGEKYLVDALTKRVFKSSWFKKAYNLKIDSIISKEEFNSKQKSIYEEQTETREDYGWFLMLSLPIYESIKGPKLEETMFEIEESKKYFPEAFKDMERIQEDMMTKKFI